MDIGDIVAQHVLLRALVDEFARCGVRHAVACPGSRDTPIVEALLAEQRITTHSVIDERSAGFFAVGVARADAGPVLVTVTSGTAVANLLPAAVEASEAGLPLILLTADRPTELRGVGAGQTIDQVKLFGSFARLAVELDLADASPQRRRLLRSLACRAYAAARWPDPGPVHLNVPLREPLVLDGPLPDDDTGRPGGRPYVSGVGGLWAAGGHAAITDPVPAGPRPRRTVVVLGPAAPMAGPGSEWALAAARASVPVLADPLSGARRGEAAIAHYDLILRHPGTAAALAPDLVIRVGDLPTSKPLRAWLAALDGVEQVALEHRPTWPDPSASMSVRGVGGPELLPALPGAEDYLAAWREADAAVAEAIDATLGGDLSEPALARLLGARLPSDATLVVAASMPIRDIETYVEVREDPPRYLANRGANGIDGTVSTAFGVAATGAETVLLVGDVTLLHDIGGLLCARRNGLKLTVVLIDNDGGAIFDFLPIAGHPAAHRVHVATPHGTDFTHAAALYGFEHLQPTDVGGTQAALDRALDGDRSTLIEVRTDRAANRALHAALAEAALAALSRRGPAAARRA